VFDMQGDEEYADYASHYLCGTPFSVYRGWPYLSIVIVLAFSLFISVSMALIDNDFVSSRLLIIGFLFLVLTFSAYHTVHYSTVGQKHTHIMKAVTSKMPQSVVTLSIVLAWLTYGSVIHVEEHTYQIQIIMATISIICIILSYIDRLYNNLPIRNILAIIYLSSMLLFTGSCNVIGSMNVVEVVIRVLFFFGLFLMTDVDGRSLLNIWLRYHNILGQMKRSNATVCVSSDSKNTPVIELMTTVEQVFFLLYRSAFQSMYTLFFPGPGIALLVVFFIHIIFLMKRTIWNVERMNLDASKKFDLQMREEAVEEGILSKEEVNDKEEEEEKVIERQEVHTTPFMYQPQSGPMPTRGVNPYGGGGTEMRYPSRTPDHTYYGGRRLPMRMHPGQGMPYHTTNTPPGWMPPPRYIQHSPHLRRPLHPPPPPPLPRPTRKFPARRKPRRMNPSQQININDSHYI